VKSISAWKKLIVYIALFTLNTQSWPLVPQVAIPPSPSVRFATLPGESATRLPNGRWLLLGGQGTNGVVGTAFLASPYDSSGVKLTQSLTAPRAWHTGTVLPNGTVLVLGGVGSGGKTIASPEVFDPSSLQFHSQEVSVIPRSHHSAALLSDGRMVLVGGIDANGNAVTSIEIWDPRSGMTILSQAELPIPRLNDRAFLLADGTILISGGVDLHGNPLSFGEIYDPVADRMFATATISTQDVDMSLPSLQASLPEDGAIGIAVNPLIGLRFSKLLRPDTVTAGSIALEGPTGSIPCTTVAAENGRVVFLTPKSALLPATTYTVAIQGATDEQGLQVVYKTISFTTTGESPLTANANNVKAQHASAPRHPQPNTLPKAPPNVTAVAGRVLKLDGSPLANVTLRISGKSVRSDLHGQFLLTNAPAGQQDLIIDGRSASTGAHSYGVFEVGIQLFQGQTLALPFAIWMTELDMAHAVRIKFPTTKEVVVTTPTLPGLEFRIPPNTVITDIDGKVATQISITPIPLRQPPFPLPEVEVPIYFTIQPGGGSIWVNGAKGTRGARLVYPNTYNWPVGRSVDFWNYDPYTARGWYVYGQGKVAPDHKSIIPNPGVEIYQLTGAMVGGSGWGPNPGPHPDPGDPEGASGQGGEPVDLSTGLFIYQKADLYLPDVIPISLTRVYRNSDSASRNFGIGTTLPYDMFIVGNLNDFSWIELVLPTGGRVRFDRTVGNSWEASTLQCVTSPGPFYGAIFSNNGTGNGGWVITLRDGTILKFIQPGFFGAQNYQGVALTSITDRNGNQVNILRNSNNYITQIQSPNGRWIQLNYDNNNPPRVTSALDSLGRTVSYTYDPNLGTLNKVVDANNGVWNYGYDSNYEMTSITDARQIQYLQNFYSNNRVYKQIIGAPPDTPAVYQFGYVTDSNNNVLQTTVTDPNNNVRQVTFSPPQTFPDGSFVSGGYITSDIQASGRPEQQVFTYSFQQSTNFLQSVTDNLNRTTAYTYDPLGNVNSVTKLAGTANAVTTYFNHEPSFSQLTSVVDPLNHTVTFGLDSHGNVLSVTDPLGNASLYAHDLEGRVISAADPLGNAWQMTYQGADLASIADPYGNAIGILPDEAGRPIAIIDPMGQTTRYQYNPLNRLTQITDPLGGITQLAWDPNGNLQSVKDPRNAQHPTTYQYDSNDRLQFRTDPLGKTESFGYDGDGNLTCFTDRRGQSANFTYDGLDRLNTVGYGAPSCVSTSYQSTTSYTYDAGSRPFQIVDSVAGTTTPVFDGLDRLLSEKNSQGNVSYQYDAAGRETSMTVAGQPTVSYTYDTGNRLTQIAQGSSTVTLGYDADSHRNSLALPNGISVAYTYDKDSRLTGMIYNPGPSPLGNLTYAYDADGRVSQIGGTFAHTGLPTAVTTASYDAANRLTAWGANSSFSYDANGNLQGDGTNTYFWDARNQLSSITGGVTASFQYDALGRRISKTVGGTTTGFLYDGYNVVQELTSGQPSANLLSGGIDETFTRTTTSSTSFLEDGLGSNVALTNGLGAVTTQYTYEPFGNTSNSGPASTNAFQYTGRENDGTGLYFNRARYYNPTLQRFISQDPIGFGGGTTNLYSYTANSPTNLTDPSGKGPELLLLAEGPPGWLVLGGLALGYAAYTAPTWGPALGRALSNAFQDDSAQSPDVPISTPADPNGRYGGQQPERKPDHCEDGWPSTPEAMDDMLGVEGERIPDGPLTPGRNKVIWDLGQSTITYEQHPYDVGAPDWHSGPHWHLDYPGRRHQRFKPGDKVPGCK
jgi:RHS repeat-associated protein